MTKLRKTYVDGTHGQIHLRIAGESQTGNRPLVCLHMFPQSGLGLEPLVKAMSHDRLVVAPDFPGYGESDLPRTKLDADGYARTVWETVDALGLAENGNTIDIFGIHAGAKLAVAACCQQPGRVNRLILSSAAVLSESEVRRIRAGMLPPQLDVAGTLFQQRWEMLQRNRGPGVTLEMQAKTFAEMIRSGTQASLGSEAVFDYNRKFPAALQSLHHPIALLNPKDDLYQYTPKSKPYLRNGILFDQPEWTHGFLETCADEVASFIRQFLASHFDDTPQAHTG